MSTSNPRAAPFALLSTEHGTMIVNVNDRCSSGDGGEFGVGWQLLRHSRYEPAQVSLMRELLVLRRRYFDDGVLAIDCGANVGVFTVEIAKLMTGWGKVIAIEAQEFIYYALAGNIAVNNCLNARAILAAVGERDGLIRIPVLDYTSGASFGSLELRPSENNEYIGQKVDYSERATVDARLMSLDGLRLPRLDLAKIDVEGMELEALRGAAETISRSKPICYVELLKSDRAGIASFFAERGYRAFPLGADCVFVHESDPCLGHIQSSAGTRT